MEKIPPKAKDAQRGKAPKPSMRAAAYKAIGPSVKAAKAGAPPTRARIAAVLPLDAAQALERLATERFVGNRSAALAAAVRIAAFVYRHDANRGRLVRDERDAIRAIVEAEGASV